MIQSKLRELGGNLWEFSSDVLNFPKEVGGEVSVESEGAGEERDLEEKEGGGEGCGGEFRDREFSVGDKKGSKRLETKPSSQGPPSLFSLP